MAEPPDNEPGTSPKADKLGERVALEHIQEALQGLRFQVTVIVQDGVVVQIDRTEKKRLQRGARNR